MTQSTDLPEGWIAHDGGACPVSGFVDILYRNGLQDFFEFPEVEDWSHVPNDPAGDIIAYKPEQPQ